MSHAVRTFRSADYYPESALKKSDGSTNKGAFGRAVRILPRGEFELILGLGLSERIAGSQELESELIMPEEILPYGEERRRILIERSASEAVFSRNIQKLYQSTCALTGLRIINDGGRCEIEAAHIRPVAADGPDSPRNGLALIRTVHWLFDRGIMSIDDTGRILAATEFLPELMLRLINPDRKVSFPADSTRRPRPAYLDFHRRVVCQGKNLRPLV